MIFRPLFCVFCSFSLAALPGMGWAQGLTQPAEEKSVTVRVPAAKEAAVVPTDYRLDVGDVVNVDVQRHGEVSRTVKLNADGKIRLPRLMTPIDAVGKTCLELVDEITKNLTEEGKLRLRPGQVTVNVVEMRMRRIYVRGNIGRSGDFDLKNGWRLTELYAVIGGVPAPERVTARLLNPERPAPLTISLPEILSNPDRPQNVPLKEGDTLILEGPRTKRLFVKGEGPRGSHELDERFGLRQALIQLGYTTTNASGDVRHARLLRREIPGDPNSPETVVPVDLFNLLNDDTTADVPLRDMDTLDIPVSQRFVYIYGEIAAPRKFYLREDQPTYLIDIMSLGGTSGRAKINDVKILRKTADGKPAIKSYQFGKFLGNGDPKQNPEILPQDIVFVPDVKRADVVGSIWQAWGLFGIVQAVFPQARIR